MSRAENAGARLAVLRGRAGLTQTSLADLVGINQATVSCWENGRYRPSVGVLPKLSRALGCTVEELLKLLDVS